MKVLVTGGSGFIGSHVVDQLLVAGHEPVIFDFAQSVHHPPTEVKTILGDIADRDTAWRAVHGCDAIIHLAAVADVSDVVADPLRADRTNVHGTQIILDAARHGDISRVVYGSTVWVYGDSPGEQPLDEGAPLALPAHFYTATKLAGEMYCRSYTSLYGTPHTILRFGIPYGPRARPAAVVPSFVARAQEGKALTIAGDGRQTRQFVYVEDLAAGIVAGLAATGANGIYNLVGDEQTSVRQIADTIREVVKQVPLVHGPERPADVHIGYISGARAKADLGWEPQTPFLDGVRRYVDWLATTNGSPLADTASSIDGSAATVLRQESAEL
ncbi:MAG: NAD-dependent epimerase/dehydratase family protein [Actinobacteria bacterium]|nr:NAD-dependent epimerase/dehydratase family protein [Actinomycetota bacterium]